MTETLPWPAQNIALWLPVWQAAGFFLATFVLEDVATVGAGVLLAAGAVSGPVAFASCFLGIWAGDAGLYALARFAGRKWFDRSRWHRHAARVAVSERWFAERGLPILIFTRMLPGTRLPTYLAAGFLRVPAPRFLWITGIAAGLWTALILGLAQLFGNRLVAWLQAGKQDGWILLGIGVLAYLGLRGLRRVDWRHVAVAWGRCYRWEFWPAWVFYPPVVVYCLWLAIKYRGLSAPTAANPGIFSGGLVGESKMALLQELLATSPEFTARAALLPGETVAERLRALAEVQGQLDLAFPVVLKPDVGQRGAGVKLIHNDEQAEAYLRQTAAPLLVQRYAPGPGEVGVFYYRFPHESHGHIFAITEKIFPTITGDGRSTVAELIWQDSRARFMARQYLRRFAGREDEVLPAGETLRLVAAGNHAQGCIFQDGMRLNTPALAARIDEISRRLPGFFIGRYDIRFAEEADLRAGRNFQIIELNGAAAEATSIYDARNSLRAAYRTLFRQWELVFAIGAANRDRGCPPARVGEVWRAWRDYARTAATYPLAD